MSTHDDLAPYSVEYWGSHPDAGNDDCWIGSDHVSHANALAEYETDPSASGSAAVRRESHTIAFIALTRQTPNPDGRWPLVEHIAIRPNPAYDARRVAREQARDDAAARAEYAMQAGMGLGVNAYNDAMGY